MLNDILSGLGFSEEESKTYTTLLQTGPLSAGQLAKKIGSPRPSTYGFLAKLVEKKVVTENDDKNVKIFTAQRPEVITGLFRSHIEDMVRKRIEFERMIPDLEGMMAPHVLAPRYEAFEGKQAMQNVLKDMLLYSGIETRTYWPAKAMAGMMPSSFWAHHDKLRRQNKVDLKAIWPEDQIVRGVYTDLEAKREIRIAPPEVKSTMGYWIYKHKVAFFSSLRACSGFVVESAELAEMMSAQHELVWLASKPHEKSEQQAA